MFNSKKLKMYYNFFKDILFIIIASMCRASSYAECITFRENYDDQENIGCFLGIVTNIVTRNIGLLDTISPESSCVHKEKSKKKIVLIFERNEILMNRCNHVVKLSLNRTDIIIPENKKCSTSLFILLKKLKGQKISHVLVRNYSEYCNPKKVIVEAYCCM